MCQVKGFPVKDALCDWSTASRGGKKGAAGLEELIRIRQPIHVDTA